LSLARACERLRDPKAREAYSPLFGGTPLLVELRGADPCGTEETERFATALEELPCPSVALVAETPAGGTGSVANLFDVAVETPEELRCVIAGIERSPLAATALVQLLRGADRRRASEAILAESWVYAMLQAGPEHLAWLASREPPRPRAAPQEPAVLIERAGETLVLTLNRPATHNAYGTEMRDRLIEGLELARVDPSLVRVMLRGSGPSFCSGGDLSEFGSRSDPATAHAVRSTRNAARLLAEISDRIHVEIHGSCIGAGIELAAFARRVRARPDATFELPEVAMGLIPGAGGTASIPRRIGRQRTAYLALTGVRIDASTALAWRLVDEIADAQLAEPVAG
jgi:enoyl-CoA hydratase/carnithine racemase